MVCAKKGFTENSYLIYSFKVKNMQCFLSILIISSP